MHIIDIAMLCNTPVEYQQALSICHSQALEVSSSVFHGWDKTCAEVFGIALQDC